MSYGLFQLILALIFAGALVIVLWSIFGDQYTDEQIEAQSRHRIRMELNDIELHRPDHIIDHTTKETEHEQETT